MLKTNMADWELLDDLSQMSDLKLLQMLSDAKRITDEIEAKSGDSEQATIDAVLWWETIDTLEHEKRVRDLKKIQIGFRTP